MNGNGASTGAAERLKLNLWVNAAVHHRVTRRRQAATGRCVTVSRRQSLFHSVVFYFVCARSHDEMLTHVILPSLRDSMLRPGFKKSCHKQQNAMICSLNCNLNVIKCRKRRCFTFKLINVLNIKNRLSPKGCNSCQNNWDTRLFTIM